MKYNYGYDDAVIDPPADLNFFQEIIDGIEVFVYLYHMSFWK